MLKSTSTLGEIDDAIARARKGPQRESVHAQAVKILTVRATHDSRSGHRAAVWLNTHAQVASATQVKANAKTTRTPTGGNLRTQLCVTTFGPLSALNAADKTEWWNLYRSLKDTPEPELVELLTAARA